VLGIEPKQSPKFVIVARREGAVDHEFCSISICGALKRRENASALSTSRVLDRRLRSREALQDCLGLYERMDGDKRLTKLIDLLGRKATTSSQKPLLRLADQAVHRVAGGSLWL
jgi:hypothetical protein